MKKLTLDETWEQCLKMWRWIVRQKCPRDAWELKYKWIKEHGYPRYESIEVGCFFCDYTIARKRGCSICPARKIDKDFNCENAKYNWETKPAAFLRKITELNKIRLERKKGNPQ